MTTLTRLPTARLARGHRLLIGILVAVLGLGASAPTVHGATLQRGGAVLDGFGNVHAFGGLALNTYGTPFWPNWDIARALTVREDGSGGWELDGFGGIHPFGSAAPINRPGYWPNWDIARDLVVVSRTGGILDGASGYVLDGFGGIHPFGSAPALCCAPYTANLDLARGLSIHLGASGVPDGGWLLRTDGTIIAFGGAPALPLSLPRDDVQLKLHVLGNGQSGFSVASWGATSGFGVISPYWNGYTDWGSWAIGRDIQVLDPSNPTPQSQPMSYSAQAAYAASLKPHGGAVLDGFGGIHQLDGWMFQLDTRGAPYWPNWDIARSLSLRGDAGGGWELDGFGGIHAFGRAAGINTPGYWPNWDIARDMVVTSRDAAGVIDGRQGYLLDGFGSIHPWGGAPSLPQSPDFSAGFDLARGLEIHRNGGGTPDGAWILDVFGTVHAVGAAPGLGNIAPVGQVPLWRHLHAVGSGMLLAGRFGITSASGPIGNPFWLGYPDWGGWDIANDIVIVNPSSPDPTNPPASSAARAAFAGAVSGSYQNSAPLYRQLRALDCESAALQMALAGHGTYVSQDWILAVMGADTRPAVKDRYGTIVQWGNPYQTFVGNVDGSEPLATGYGVYYPPIAAAAARVGHGAKGAEGWAPRDLYALVAAGYPAVVWVPFNFAGATPRYWTAWDGAAIRYIHNEHTTTMVGVDFGRGTVTINDPEYGVKVMSMGFFESQWSSLNNMAAPIA